MSRCPGTGIGQGDSTVSIINLYRSAYTNSHDAITVNEHVAISEALPGLDFSHSIITVNGFEADENRILHGDDVCAIRMFPGGAGGALDAVFAVTAGILLPGFGASAYGIATGIHYGVTGRTLGNAALNALNNFFHSQAPDANSGSQESLAAVPQLRGAKNQSNKNKPIPIVLGRHLYAPMYVGSPYTEIAGEDGEDQYYNALYLLGWGKLEVKDIRLGPVSGLAKNAAGLTDGFLLYDKNDKFCDPSLADGNPQLELRQGAAEVSLYPQRVVEERLSIELMNAEGKSPLEVIRFTAKDPMKVQIEFTFSNGLVSYNDQGDKQDASVEILVEWRGDPAGAWQEFGRVGTSGGLSPTSYNPATHATTITRQKNKALRFVAEKTFTYAEAGGAVNRTLELRVLRANAKDPDNNRISDTVFLTAIRTWCFDNDTAVGPVTGQKAAQAPMIPKYRDKTARLGFRIKAAENLQGTIDALNCIVQSYARTWGGAGWSGGETPTNNPAAVALKILQSPALGGNAYPESMLDLDSFGEFYEWCAERGYACNGVLTAEKRVDDLLSAILATGRGMRLLNGNRYAVLIDKPRENPVAILNSQNVLEAKNQKNFEDLPDGLSVKFVNESDGYQETEVYVMADGSAGPGPGSRIESIDMPFVTDYRQVVRNGWYLLACRHLRPETWFRKLSVDGYLVGIGDRVEVQDDTIVVGIGEGAAIKGLKIENGVITGISTDGAFDVADMAKQYGVKIMQFDGIHSGKARTVRVSVPGPGTYRDFDFAAGIPLDSSPPVPHEGDIVSFGVYNRITTPAICFGKKDGGDGTFDVTLIPYQQGIYEADSGPIPPYQANVTPPQGLAPLHAVPPEPVSRNDVIEAVAEMGLAGPPGAAAVVHELRPSANAIKKEIDGKFVPDKISCSQVSIEGDSPPAPSNQTISYVTSKNSVPLAYAGPITVENWDWIEFVLSSGGIELDRERIPVLRDGESAVILDLDNQNRQILCLHDGTPKEGQLPFTVQATLYRGIRAVHDAGITYYPVAGGNGIVDPMLGDFHASDAMWSLANAPPGVAINQAGLIEVAAGAGLEMVSEITVRAVYHGNEYARPLRLAKALDGEPGEPGQDGDDGEPAPRYLGKTYSPGSGAGIVQIYDSPQSTRQVQAHKGDWVFYASAVTAGIFQPDRCYEWKNGAWAQLPYDEMGKYMDALKDITEGKDNAAFMAVFCRMLWAQKAMIDELQATAITVKNLIRSEAINPSTENPFFRLWANGLLEAENAKIIGEVHADRGTFREGVFTDIIVGGDSSFQGVSIEAGPLQVKPEGSTYNLSWNSGTSTQTILQGIANIIGKALPITVSTKSGTFQGKNVVGLYGSRIVYQLPSPIGSTSYIFTLTIILDDGAMPSFTSTIPSTLSVAIEYGDITFKLINLPISDPRINGVVWKDGNTLKISSG